MARGYLYEISTDIDFIHNMDATNIYDNPAAAAAAGYFADVNGAEKDQIIKDLFEGLGKYGFQTGTETDDGGNIQMYFTVTQEAREAWFKPRFEKAKQLVQQMTLEGFSKNVAYLLSMIEDDYGDAVMLDDSFYNFDYFIRETDENTRYYVGNVVLMH